MLEKLPHLINPRAYFNLFKDIFKTLINPKLEETKPWSLSILITVFMTAIIGLILANLGIIITLLSKIFIEFDYREELIDNKIFLVISAVIIAPVLEELIFRLPQRFTSRNAFVSTVLLIFIQIGFVVIIYEILGYFIKEVENAVIYRIVFTAFISIVSGALLFLILNKFKTGIQDFGEKYFRIIFYFYTLLFGIIHIFNYKVSLTWYNFILIIPITLPQILVGFTLGYTRIKYGLKYSVLQHFIHNSILIIIALAMGDGL